MGKEWVASHISDFVALGGPFLGSVAMLQAVMIDGTFSPLDLLFSESQMLTILRSVPVGQYLQPVGDWKDGLDLPFILIRDQSYITLSIGQLDFSEGFDSANLATAKLAVQYGKQVVQCKHALYFHRDSPFVESISFSFENGMTVSEIRVTLSTEAGTAIGTGTIVIHVDTPKTEVIELTLRSIAADKALGKALGASGAGTQVELPWVGKLELQSEIGIWNPKDWLPTSGHPLSAHNGASCPQTDHHRWSPGSVLALHACEKVFQQPLDTWQVPTIDNGFADDHSIAPPVANVTAVYGTGMRTPRTLFLRRRQVQFRGGLVDKMEALFELDPEGDVDGLLTIGGIGYETPAVAQLQPATHEQVFASGDGTVNYQSLRHVATWSSDTCNVDICELPGCNHRGVSYDARMLKVLEGVLGLESPISEANQHQQSAQGSQSLTSRKIELRSCDVIARDNEGRSWGTNNAFCSIFAKLGSRSLNLYRRKLSYIVRGLVLIHLAICIFALVYALSVDFTFVKRAAWASGKYEPVRFGSASGIALGWEKKEFDLGVLSFSYTGDPLIENVTYLQYASIQVYELDDTCTQLTQKYSSVVFNYGKVSHSLSFRPADAIFCMSADCLTGAVALWAPDESLLCINRVADLWNGYISDTSCIDIQFSYNNVRHSFSLQLSCVEAVETEITNGFLPVLSIGDGPPIGGPPTTNNVFVFQLVGMSATEFDAYAQSIFKDTVAKNAGSVCGWSGILPCTSLDCEIIDSTRRDVIVTFTLATYSAASAESARAALDGYLPSAQIVTDLAERDVRLVGVRVISSEVVQVTRSPTVAPTVAPCLRTSRYGWSHKPQLNCYPGSGATSAVDTLAGATLAECQRHCEANPLCNGFLFFGSLSYCSADCRLLAGVTPINCRETQDTNYQMYVLMTGGTPAFYVPRASPTGICLNINGGVVDTVTGYTTFDAKYADETRTGATTVGHYEPATGACKTMCDLDPDCVGYLVIQNVTAPGLNCFLFDPRSQSFSQPLVEHNQPCDADSFYTTGCYETSNPGYGTFFKNSAFCDHWRRSLSFDGGEAGRVAELNERGVSYQNDGRHLLTNGPSTGSGPTTKAADNGSLGGGSPKEASANSAMIVLRNEAAYYFSSLVDVEFIHCHSLTSATIKKPGEVEKTISMPYSEVSVSSSVPVTLYCIDRKGLAESTRGLPTGDYEQCTNTYRACKEVGDEGTGLWSRKSSNKNCHKGLPHSMCDACYSAGVDTTAFLVFTGLIQIPLVWLSVVRTNMRRDSRCYKFWALPISFLHITMGTFSVGIWRTDCYEELQSMMGEAIVIQPGLDGHVHAYTNIHWPSTIPLIAAGLTFVVWILSVVTPVPELFQNDYLDPEYVEMKENSAERLREKRITSRALSPSYEVRESSDTLMKYEDSFLFESAPAEFEAYLPPD